MQRLTTATLLFLISVNPSVTANDETNSRSVGAGHPPESARTTSDREVRDLQGQLQLSFEANAGQTDERVRFLARGNGYTLFLTPTEAVLSLQRSAAVAPEPGALRSRRLSATERAVVRMKLLGARSDVRMEGLEVLPGKVNYLVGADRHKWRQNVPTYARVAYRNVYPGVDLEYYGRDGELEYDFIVAAGTDPSAIRLAFDGANLTVDASGDLIASVAGGDVRMRKPVLYQDVGGQRMPVTGDWKLTSASEAGFRIGNYDTARPLVIDPVLSYSTYLGRQADDQGAGIAVDRRGHAYVTGFTTSTDFPTTAGAVQTVSVGSGGDAYVTKFDRAGATLVYSTYFGGSDSDAGNGIAVDLQGNAYVVGITFSVDLPTTPSALHPFRGQTDAFVMKLNRDGSELVYSTYLGGAEPDSGTSIAVDAAGRAFVTGDTSSVDFPTTPGAVQTINAGRTDGFVASLSRSGATLRYSTYLGGSAIENAADIDIDAAGHAFVTGSTRSADFPTTPGAFQPDADGLSDEAFVAKLNRSGTALVYSTHLGSINNNDYGFGIAVDAFGHAYVTGATSSSDFPTTPGAFDRTGSDDAFVTKLNRAGSGLLYSTYLGGSGQDWGSDIAVDLKGNAYVLGSTRSADFPTARAFQRTFGGIFDAFVTKLDRTGSTLAYSTYLGGSDLDDGMAIALDWAGNAYVTGNTSSDDLPTTAGSFQPLLGGDRDAFVAKLTDPPRRAKKDRE
jgi:hypothetical protein